MPNHPVAVNSATVIKANTTRMLASREVSALKTLPEPFDTTGGATSSLRSRAWPVTPSSYHRTVSRTRRSHPPRRPRSHRHWLAGAHVIALAGAHQASYPPIPRFRRILPIGSCKSGVPAPARRCSSRFALVRAVGRPLIRASPEWGRRAVPRLARRRKRCERSVVPRPSAVVGLRFLAHALRHAAR